MAAASAARVLRRPVAGELRLDLLGGSVLPALPRRASPMPCRFSCRSRPATAGARRTPPTTREPHRQAVSAGSANAMGALKAAIAGRLAFAWMAQSSPMLPARSAGDVPSPVSTREKADLFEELADRVQHDRAGSMFARVGTGTQVSRSPIALVDVFAGRRTKPTPRPPSDPEGERQNSRQILPKWRPAS